MDLAYALTVAYFPKFLLTNSFYLYGLPEFSSPTKIFLCTVHTNTHTTWTPTECKLATPFTAHEIKQVHSYTVAMQDRK